MLNHKEFDKKQSAIFNKYGAFFAFSNKQFDEQKKEGVKYASMYAGLIAPKENAESLHEALSSLAHNHAIDELAEYGAEKIIMYELSNHEAQISGCIDDTVGAVEIYGITREQVAALYPKHMKLCRENDWF